MPIIRGNSPRFAHIRALQFALWTILDTLGDGPENATRRVAVRNHIAALRRAYPGECEVMSDTDLEQWLAEEDGHAIQDAP